MGSAGTLLSAAALKSLAFIKPLHQTQIQNLSIYENPIPNHTYVCTVDTSRGKGLDYSAFTVIDVTQVPYRLVATYRDNDISPLVYPTVIRKVCEHYNSAYALVEINDIGQQVVDTLFDDYAYENILSTIEKDKKTAVTWSAGGDRGVRTTKSVKRLGCSLMKNLIEGQKLLIQDFQTIAELSTFIAKKGSYEADDGCHDDLVMCLVLFSWLTNQEFFTDLSNINIKEKLYEQQLRMIEEESLPTFLAGHLEMDNPNRQFVSDGSVWDIIDSQNS
jgi:hypothetical protein